MIKTVYLFLTALLLLNSCMTTGLLSSLAGTRPLTGYGSSSSSYRTSSASYSQTYWYYSSTSSTNISSYTIQFYSSQASSSPAPLTVFIKRPAYWPSTNLYISYSGCPIDMLTNSPQMKPTNDDWYFYLVYSNQVNIKDSPVSFYINNLYLEATNSRFAFAYEAWYWTNSTWYPGNPEINDYSFPVVELIDPTNNSTFNTNTPFFLMISATDTPSTSVQTLILFESVTTGIRLTNHVKPAISGFYTNFMSISTIDSFNVWAVAVDSSGNTAVSPSNRITVTNLDLTPPSGSFISPLDNAYFPVSNTIPVLIQASDQQSGIFRVTLYYRKLGTNLIYTNELMHDGDIYETSYNSGTNGYVIFWATLRDQAGNMRYIGTNWINITN